MGNDTRFGIFYPITRIALAVIIIIQIVLLVVDIIDCDGCLKSAKAIIFIILTILVLFIGAIGAWKEHFLFTLIFAVTEVILCIFGFVISRQISSGGVIITVIIASIYAVMLYMLGKRDMRMPHIV